MIIESNAIMILIQGIQVVFTMDLALIIREIYLQNGLTK